MIEVLVDLGESVDRLSGSGDSPLLIAAKQSKLISFVIKLLREFYNKLIT